jgi:hypothetical protein
MAGVRPQAASLTLYPYLHQHYMMPFGLLASLVVIFTLLWKVYKVRYWRYGSLRYILELENLTNRYMHTMVWIMEQPDQLIGVLSAGLKC